jgi:hypothetical protein
VIPAERFAIAPSTLARFSRRRETTLFIFIGADENKFFLYCQ